MRFLLPTSYFLPPNSLSVIETLPDDVEIVLHLLTEDVEPDKLVNFVAVVDPYLAVYFDNEVSLFCQLMHFVCMPDGVLYPNVVHEPFP